MTHTKYANIKKPIWVLKPSLLVVAVWKSQNHPSAENFDLSFLFFFRFSSVFEILVDFLSIYGKVTRWLAQIIVSVTSNMSRTNPEIVLEGMNLMTKSIY